MEAFETCAVTLKQGLVVASLWTEIGETKQSKRAHGLESMAC